MFPTSQLVEEGTEDGMQPLTHTETETPKRQKPN